MSKLTDGAKRVLQSQRIRNVPRPDEPSNFAKFGGWGQAADAAAARLDPIEQETNARRAGAEALARLAAERLEDLRAASDRRLAGVQRGRNYGDHVKP